MKLLHCLDCHDVVALRTDGERACACGGARGRYVDDLVAEFSGRAVLLGFANRTLVHALQAHEQEPNEAMGHRFEAFVIPESAYTCRRVERPDPEAYL